MSPDDTTRAILSLLAEGRDVRQILAMHKRLTREDVQAAAAQALTALETGESREARIARVRLTHPRAFTEWTPAEEAKLLARRAEGVALAAIARELERPPGALRARLEKLLGPDWREKRGGPLTAERP